MKKISITHVSNEHNSWLRGLDFYKTEINILKGYLTEIAKKNTGPDVMREVEHFENQFTVQQEKIDALNHSIVSNLNHISREAQRSSVHYIDGALLTDHTILGQKYNTEERIANDLRHSFRRFAEQWM